MKISELEIGKLYKIKDTARLEACKTSIMDIPVIRWGHTVNKTSILKRESIFQYLGKTKIKRLLRIEQKSLHYNQHIFMLLSDSIKYVIRGYHVRNIELLN
mgnify:CR=1|tara:strand:+ start:198 stop:500 length:303 start_codon:yes stop_codon:yes gene_type:complete